MSKGSIAFTIILVFIIGIILGSLSVSIMLSSNTNYKPYTVEINDFVNIKVYTNSYYDLHKLKQYIANMEDFVYTDDNMIFLAGMIQERFRSVVNVRYIKSDGSISDSTF